MLNIKKRIENLQKSSENPGVIDICKESLNKLKGAYTPLTPYNQKVIIDETISEDLIERLSSYDDLLVKDFIVSETRLNALNNLGVREAIKNLFNDELAQNVSVKYVLENLKQMFDLPEWKTAASVVETLKQFDYSPMVQENIQIIKNNIDKYNEDIKIYSAISESIKGTSAYLLNGIEKQLNEYLNRRTPSNRTQLLESLNKFIFDPGIKNLYNVISESSNGFYLKPDTKDSFVKSVFSPVFVNEKVQYFAVNGKFFSRKGDLVNELSESEVNYLPENFVWVAKFLTNENVSVQDNLIKIYSKDKKIEIFERDENVFIKLNEKEVSVHDFERIYLNSGVFSQSERPILKAVFKIVENWNTIYELDYIKSIYSNTNKNIRVDVFNCNDVSESLHLNQVNLDMKLNKFYQNCTGTQARNLVLEFMNYDLGNTFKNLLNKEELTIKILESELKDYFEAIQMLEGKENKIKSIEDKEIRNSEEVKSLLEAISEEIDNLKETYTEINKKITGLKQISESLNVNDSVEVLKKKV